MIVQLCLAISDLALQMPEWRNVVGEMIERFGKDPSTVVILLGFLKTLVEEAWNPRIPLSVSGLRFLGCMHVYLAMLRVKLTIVRPS